MFAKLTEESKKQSQKDCFFFFKNNIFLILGMGIAAAICMYGILAIYGFSAFPDEFGYWSPAAAILGYDWSEITGLGSYYSYGYSILLVPILLLFHGGISAYRAAVVLNLLLQCIALFLVFKILDELYPGEKKEVRSIIATLAVLYPAWLFYVMTTMAEGVLYFALILSVYLMLRFLKKPGIVSGVLLSVVLIYLYLVHMRCVGTIGAGGATILLWLLSHKKEGGKSHLRSWLLLLVLIALFGLSFVLKDKVISVLYSDTSDFVLSWNDYSGIMNRLSKIISLKGLSYLFKDICGKVLYMGLATFGIAYFGIVGCVRKAIVSFRALKSKNASYRDFLWIYILLVVVFQFMVALIYLNGASAPDADRLDNFLHGRYIDFFLPILIAVGIEEMLRGEKIYTIFISTFLIVLLLSVLAVQVISVNKTQMHNAHGFTMIGMSFFIETPLADTMGYFYKEVILRVILTILVDLIVIGSRVLKQDIIISFVLIIQAILGVQACTHFIFDTQTLVYTEILLGDRLKDVLEEYPDKKVLDIYEGGVQSIELIQFGLRDTHIGVVNAEDIDIDITQYLSDDTVLFIPVGQDYEDITDSFYKEKLALGNLIMYYTP